MPLPKAVLRFTFGFCASALIEHAAVASSCESLQSRMELITGAVGERFDLKYRDASGTYRELQGFRQTEFERRVNLGGSYPLEFTRFDHHADNFVTVKIPNSDLLMADILDVIYAMPAKARAVNQTTDVVATLRPLSSSARHWHSGMPISGGQPLSAGDFSTRLAGRRFEVHSMNAGINTYEMSYLVGKQIERSLYYDLPKGQLADSGIAVRVKRWYRIEDQTNSAQMLFLKMDLPGSLDGLTRRVEMQVPLPHNMGSQEIAGAARALIATVDPRAVGAEFGPVVEIENTRYGVDIVLGVNPDKSPKVGFLTLDEFRGRVLLPGSPQEFGAPTIQIEYEILPASMPEYQRNAGKFAKLFSDIEKIYRGTIDTRPKYLQVWRSRETNQ